MDCLLNQATALNSASLGPSAWKLYCPSHNIQIAEWELKKNRVCWEICSALEMWFCLLLLDNDILSVFHFLYFCDDSSTYVGDSIDIKIIFLPLIPYHVRHPYRHSKGSFAALNVSIGVYKTLHWHHNRYRTWKVTVTAPLGLLLWYGQIFYFSEHWSTTCTNT